MVRMSTPPVIVSSSGAGPGITPFVHNISPANSVFNLKCGIVILIHSILRDAGTGTGTSAGGHTVEALLSSHGHSSGVSSISGLSTHHNKTAVLYPTKNKSCR